MDADWSKIILALAAAIPATVAAVSSLKNHRKINQAINGVPKNRYVSCPKCAEQFKVDLKQ